MKANDDAVLFPVPESPYFDSGIYTKDQHTPNNEIRCSILEGTYNPGGGVADIDEDMLTASVEVSAYAEGGPTFHSKLGALMSLRDINSSIEARIEEVGVALFYLYVWGWYTGFIEMPLFSIQELLLSGQPFVVYSGDEPYSQTRRNLQQEQISTHVGEMLQRYQLLASLFVDESDDSFDTEHFGFLTPENAYKKYKNYYEDRSKAYFGRVLGNFLQKVPAVYRQQ